MNKNCHFYYLFVCVFCYENIRKKSAEGGGEKEEREKKRRGGRRSYLSKIYKVNHSIRVIIYTCNIYTRTMYIEDVFFNSFV